MAAAPLRWLCRKHTTVLLLIALGLVARAHGDDKFETTYLIRSVLGEVEELEQACSPAPVSKEHLSKLLRKRTVVGRVLKVNGKVEEYVLYELKPEGFHILHMAGRSKGSLEPARSILLNELRDSKRPGNLFLTADTAVLGPEQLKILEGSGFEPLTPAQQRAAKGTGFHQKANLVFQTNRDEFDKNRIKALTHFEKFRLSLNSDAADVESRFKMLQVLYPPSTEAGRAIEEARQVLTHPFRRSEYVQANASRIKANVARPESASKVVPDSLNLYERLGHTFGDGELSSQALVRQSFDRAIVEAGDTPQKTAALAEALHVLKDPDLREIYDTTLATTTGADTTRALQRFLHGVFPEKYARPNSGLSSKPERVVKDTASIPYTKPDPQSKNLFQRLGVAENAGPDKLVDGLLEALSQHSTDERAKKKLIEAFHVLNHEETRTEYLALRSSERGPTKAELDKIIRKAQVLSNPESVPDPAFDGGKFRRGVFKSVPSADSYYARLGVPENASHPKIVDAFITAFPRTKEGSPERENLMQAYGALSDPDLRDSYDDIAQITDPSSRAEALAAFEEINKKKEEFESEAAAKNPSLYKLIGVTNTASYDLIEKRFLERIKTASDQERQTLITAFSVLRDPQLKLEYDLVTKKGTVDADYRQLVERGEELDTLRMLRGEMRSDEAKSSLGQFVKQTKNWTGQLHRDPKTAVEYLNHLKPLIRAQSNVPTSDLKSAIELLELLRLTYAVVPERQMRTFRSVLLELRGELAQKVVEGAKQEGIDPGTYYPRVQPGDLVSKLIAEARQENPPQMSFLRRCLGRLSQLVRRKPEGR